MGPLRLLQINLNRCRGAHDLMDRNAGQQEVDLCLVSEPNKAATGATNWYTDDEKDVAIWCSNPRGVTISRWGRGNGFVFVQVDDVLLYSCYCSPNSSRQEFDSFLEEISRSIEREGSDNFVVAGDFNAAAEEWGSRRTCKRGAALLDWIFQNNLLILNDRRTPTFYRRGQESFIDLTMCSARLAARLGRWCVQEENESLSDHRYIGFEVDGDTTNIVTQPRTWISSRNLKRDVLKREIVKGCRRLADDPHYGDIMSLLHKACQMASPRIHPTCRGRRPKYWWNSEIAQARVACNRARRVCTRARGKATGKQLDDYKGTRKQLRTLIRRSKEAKWKELCEEVECDPFGMGYKIARKKLVGAAPKLPEDLVNEIVLHLFPRQAPPDQRPTTEGGTIPTVTVEEVKEAGRGVKTGKAPGPDEIPPEATRYLLLECPEIFQKVSERILTEGRFPDLWKRARLVLIPKPGRPAGDPSAYRPLCLLSTVGKAMEALIAARLWTEIERNRSLSDRQFGFRRGCSTLGALEQVMQVAEQERRRTLKTRNLCLVILLDVKNAFNSMSWNVVIERMEQKGFSPYLRRIISSYLKDRVILPGNDSAEFEVTAGVPQGSILGPVLWNIAYDDVLELTMPEGVKSVAYADDLALVITARNEPAMEAKANEALRRIGQWMGRNHLALAPEKSEAVLLIGKKRCGPLNIQLEGYNIIQKKEAKYLGIMLDRAMTGSAHVRYVCCKASKVVADLSRLMPRTGGAGEAKRRLLATVADSVVLYGASVWGPTAMKYKGNRNLLRSTQRKIALRICRAYRTVSTPAALVLARLLPWDLVIEEKSKRNDLALEPETARERTLENLQREWRAASEQPVSAGAWTRQLIPDIRAWYGRGHGDMTFHLTQAFTGHGVFQEYLHRIGRASSWTCVLCDTGEKDDVVHTVERCPFFEEKRATLTQSIGRPLKALEMVNIMLKSAELWSTLGDFVEYVMRVKERKERARQALARPTPGDPQ